MGPWPIPTINTLLLLSSGVTLTIAHHALKENKRGALTGWLALTILLGFVFLGWEFEGVVPPSSSPPTRPRTARRRRSTGIRRDGDAEAIEGVDALVASERGR